MSLRQTDMAGAEGPARQPDLTVERLTKRFEGITAVANVSFQVWRGERLALLGPNGAGKTTLFNLVAGDLFPTAGRIILFGEEITRFPTALRVHRGMRRTYQTPALFDSLSVGENLYLAALGPGRRHHFRAVRTAYQGPEWPKAAEAAEKIGLDTRFFALAGELSHGERRQLEIGMALCEKPRIVLLDEPAAGLSPTERVKLTQLLGCLPRETTLLLIEHDMEIALRVSERVIVMSDGHIVAQGAPDEIVASEVVQQVYLGQKHAEPVPC